LQEFSIHGVYYACSNYGKVVELINDYNISEYTTVEDIDNIYIIPASFIPVTIGENEAIDLTFAISTLPYGFQNPMTVDDSISKPTSIDGYIPKNKKLLTKEFNYLVVSNEVGATEDFAYENFRTSKCEFLLSAVPCAGCNGILTPIKYGNASR
jgi:hypothetical protein